MSRQSELNSYIAQIQQRLRLGTWVRGAAIFTGTALVTTIALVLLLNRFAFPSPGVTGARVALLFFLDGAAAFGIALPLVRLTHKRAVHKAEAANPELEQRLTTFYEKQREGGDPFLELLARDTLSFTRNAQPKMLVEDKRLFALGGAGAACLIVLVWMIAAGPGYLGYGASLLWTGPPRNAQPYYSISVTPGNVAVRRNSDQLVTAQITGMQPAKAQLYARYQSAHRWEQVAMQARPYAGGTRDYQFVLAGLPENVEYYVAAGPLESQHYTLRVLDLPSVKEIHVTYHYPKWTGLKPVTEEHSGDLRAIEGTDAQLEIAMDRPLKDGQLALDDGQSIHLTGGEGNHYRGTVHMDKDGAYHVAALDAGQPVRLSEDYFIATDKAQPPEISLDRPRGDYRASPIEEVTLGVKAADQFGLNDVHLHYSVNGGPENSVGLLQKPGAKNAEGSHTLALEDLKLVPGDVVSVYASAKDGHAESHTDISFIQVDPFEREFSQSQQSGGGAGGGAGGANSQIEISKRQKELIAATWKQQNDKTASAKDQTVTGKFLSDAQQKLRDQVNALSARIQSRDLSAATEEFSAFDQDMQAAAQAMAPSADKLKATQWKDALPLEQKALQALLRAEATFRKIQVAFGQSGGGAGGANAGRDLASLFDLELDTEKNQYETAQSVSPAEQRAKDVQDALAKLDALAKRQEEQANQRNSQQAFEQRWQQEMLRREAEQLQRQMEEMARNGQQGQQGSSGSSASSGSSSGQSGSQQSGSQQSGSQQQRSSAQGSPQSRPGSQGQQDHADQRVLQAMRQLQQAADAMKRSSGAQPDPQAAREAAEHLREAENLLSGTQQQLASGKVDSLAREASRLKDEERAQSERIDKLAGQQPSSTPADLNDTMARMRERDKLAQERQQLSNDLSRLQKNMRDSARDLAPNQPGAARQLRDALTGMDNSDLDNHTQRTADWLRRGINPNANGTESQIAQGLEKLQQQLQQAQQAMNEEKGGQRGAGSQQGQADQAAALDTIERLRNQVESMARARQGTSNQGANQQNAQAGNSSSGQPNGQASQQGQWQANQPLSRGADQQAGSNSDRRGNALSSSGDVGGPRRDTHNGGQVADSTVWGNINTGNNTYGPRGQPTSDDPSARYADTEQTFQQELRELSQLRQIVKDDPEAAKEAQELARQMQKLDPKRFPGNPEIVERMHREVLGSIDRLELALERRASGAQDSRAGKPHAIPEGYQDSVADYYRQLSKNQ